MQRPAPDPTYPSLTISPELLHIIAKTFRYFPQYKADKYRLKIETQKIPKIEQFLSLEEKNLAQIKYERDGIKPDPDLFKPKPPRTFPEGLYCNKRVH